MNSTGLLKTCKLLKTKTPESLKTVRMAIECTTCEQKHPELTWIQRALSGMSGSLFFRTTLVKVSNHLALFCSLVETLDLLRKSFLSKTILILTEPKEKPSYNERERSYSLAGSSPTTPTRKAKPSYKLPVYSINFSSIFRARRSERWSKKTMRNAVPKALAVGPSWSRCCFANSPMPNRCARFVTAWAVVGKLVHLGIAKAPNKSTLSYANEHRPAKLYEDLFYTALQRFRDEDGLGARKKKFRFKNKLLSLDSTTISLCLDLFPWAKFRRAKGGVKAHVLLDHDDYLPRYVLITEAKRSDVKMADAFPLNPGSIVAMDRGYIDYLCSTPGRRRNLLCYPAQGKCGSIPRRRAFPKTAAFLPTNYPTPRRPGLNRTALAAAAGGGLGRGERTGDCSVDEPTSTWRFHDCRHLQRTLGDRTLFQGAKAKSQDEELCGHQ